ncbi:MAG: Type 1 glutamine amidotransferase-like domain-containing protein [Candidatus Bathyarchaeia archaeon]
MVKLYFLGGEDVIKKDSKEINKKAFCDAGGAPAVLIFPWTAKSVAKADKYKEILKEYFKELGASDIEFAELSDSLDEIEKKINRSDLIYLPGGDTKILVRRLKNADADKLLQKSGKVIIGNSAGALALCKECILTKGRTHHETVIFSGLGLVDFSVDVHYESSKDRELKRLSMNRKIYAIPERSALVYNNGEIYAIGDICLFHKGEKQSIKQA